MHTHALTLLLACIALVHVHSFTLPVGVGTCTYTVCCVLCAVCCVLCAVCCVLCAVCCMLYAVCCMFMLCAGCVLCAVCCMQYAVRCILYAVSYTLYPILMHCFTLLTLPITLQHTHLGPHGSSASASAPASSSAHMSRFQGFRKPTALHMSSTSSAPGKVRLCVCVCMRWDVGIGM
jgi:hypothetical protein